jgi:hypothetical protein
VGSAEKHGKDKKKLGVNSNQIGIPHAYIVITPSTRQIKDPRIFRGGNLDEPKLKMKPSKSRIEANNGVNNYIKNSENLE